MSCEWVSCLQHRGFSGVPSRKPKLPLLIRSCEHELQLVFLSEFCHCEVEVFLLLRVVDLPVDVNNVLDVSASEIVAFPSTERLAFYGFVLVQRQIMVAVEEAFEAHQYSDEESNVWPSATVDLSQLHSRVFQANVVLRR